MAEVLGRTAWIPKGDAQVAGNNRSGEDLVNSTARFLAVLLRHHCSVDASDRSSIQQNSPSQTATKAFRHFR
jgi:hypothetical protein